MKDDVSKEKQKKRGSVVVPVGKSHKLLGLKAKGSKKDKSSFKSS